MSPNLDDKYLKNLKDKLEKFFDKTKEADLLIIKTHLICEYYLDQIIILKDKTPKNLNFPQKIDTAIESDNDFNILTRDLLRILNNLRNRVGHELEYSLSESDIDSIGHKLGKSYIVQKYETEDHIELLRYALQKIIIKTWVVVEGYILREKEIISKEN